MPKVTTNKPQPKPQLVNRGPAGLLSKKKGTVTTKEAPEKPRATSGPDLWALGTKNQILTQLDPLIVDIDSLNQDSENARLHPERNMASIKDSLCLYGQCKPVVVQRWSERKQMENVIVAGNGTTAAAKELGWDKIAAVITDMTDTEAAGYGLADNRTAELAKWDFEVVARLDALLREQGVDPVGFSADELEVLRMADWTPPAIEEGEFSPNGEKPEPLMVSFTPDQYQTIGQAITEVRERDGEELSQDEALVAICQDWLAANTTEV